jgi:hypothetical protein
MVAPIIRTIRTIPLAQAGAQAGAKAALGAFMFALCMVAGAQPAGEVEFSRGVGLAQTPGQTPRTLGRGLPLKEGDRLTTSEGASAIIKLQDGTRMTVRPNSELVIQHYQFKENAPDNSMLMQLVRGGFRAVTGLIAKNSPNAARVQTSTATIGIRGTDFDARLCTRDCALESARNTSTPRPNAVRASAKIISAQGEVSAVDAAGQRRRVVDGGSVYPGDLVETGSDTRAVLAFRDDTRITLGGTTRFRIDNFVYDEKNATEGRFLVSVLKGSVRALTGLIAKANNRNVGFSTATATIGIRGTGLDIICSGVCAGEPGDAASGLTLFTWLGSIAVTPSGQSALQVLQAGQGLFISPAGMTPLDTAPGMDGPRPDSITPPPKLFSSDNVSDAEEGLFVLVRDGHIEIKTAGDILHLGKGEAGFAGLTGDTKRPAAIPKFLDFDPIPLPGSRNPLLVSVLTESGVQASEQCK